ncbi:MAG: hypothetical protein ACREL5_08195 [Gemmatimonadales bacterium]
MLLSVTIAAGRLSGQVVTMPAGDYVIQARDSAHAAEIGVVGWPFVLKGNGSFTLTSPDSLSFMGKLTQKDGMATFTDQTCADTGVYYVRQERGGYAFDVKSEACPGRDSSWVKLLFIPGKSQKSP